MSASESAAKLKQAKIDQKATIAKSVRDEQNEMFATYPTIGDLVEQQQIKGETVALILMAVNTTLEMVANKIEKDEG
jgi:hypothetical protein